MTQSGKSDQPQIVPDSEHRGLMARLPASLRPFAALARLDRPIGWMLLFFPGVWAVALAGGILRHYPLIMLLLIGSIAMRGAGCVLNDIVDRDIDAKVKRTAVRPLPSGQVTLRAAWLWLCLLCLIGLGVLLQLNRAAQITALASLALVAAYPFMKRITGWPQVWLGLVFSWAALVGWVAVRGVIELPGLLLYAGAIFWVIGYDTIYALQDREDDALIGIGSSALSMGRHVKAGVGLCYALALSLWSAGFWLVRPVPLTLTALLPVALHLGWQVATLRTEDGTDALAKFRANRLAGLIMALACIVVAR